MDLHSKLTIILLTYILQKTLATKCYLNLEKFCVQNGIDGFLARELEIQIIYYNAKEDGQWYTLTNNTFLDVPINGCVDMNEIVWVPNHGSILFQVIEDDLVTDDVYQILHRDACNPNYFSGLVSYWCL